MIKKEHVIVFNLFFLLDCFVYITLNIQIIIIFICTYNIYMSCIISKEY